MRVLLVCEGFHEHADPVYSEDDAAGALEVLIRRLIGQDIEIVSRKVTDPEFRNIKHHGKGHGYTKKAVGLMRWAERKGFGALVLLIDRDEQPDRSAAMDEAQSNGLFSIARACGVAVEKFDAWILADEHAFSAVVGTHMPARRDPEALSDPKALCQQLRDESSCMLRLRDLYADCAGRLRIEVLKQRCPKGFAPFAERVERLGQTTPA